MTAAVQCISGTDSTPMFVLAIRQQAMVVPSLLVTDSGGRIVFATSAMAGILGYEAEQLVGSDMSKLMSPPFSHLHGSWMKVRS
jgi:PAS domain S-box-containing protein